MPHLPETTAAREALEQGDLRPEERQADLADIRARWAESTRQEVSATAWWRYAAAAAVLLFVAWSVQKYQEAQRPLQIYAQHFEANRDLDYLTVRGAASSTALADLVAAIRSEKYQEALLLSRELTTANPFDTQALLYQAVAAMGLQEFAEAARALDQALALEMPTVERISAHWYRALVHLAVGEYDAARQELEWVMANSQGQRKSSAEALLKDL
ncbi:MAG: hypothetical protein D6772_05685 [Bacteroidetes bacterium]|nr:MAG: hypothetical protein D6772_05685 [Bacteroidota bacterium]